MAVEAVAAAGSLPAVGSGALGLEEQAVFNAMARYTDDQLAGLLANAPSQAKGDHLADIMKRGGRPIAYYRQQQLRCRGPPA